MKRLMNKFICVVLALFVIMTLSSCGRVKKDVLYEYENDGTTPTTSAKTTAVVEGYTEMFTGNIIAYNYWKDLSVYNAPRSLEGATSGFGISTLQGENMKNISVSTNRFISASASENGEVYFTEKDPSGTEYVYFSDSLAEKKILLAKGEAGKGIVWCVSEGNTFLYVDPYNRIKSVSGGTERLIYEIPEGYTPSKIRYCETDGIIMMLATSQSSANNLYRIDLSDKRLTAIDVYVTDMSVVTSADKTAYVKIDSRGQKQLYVYDHNTVMRKYILSGNIDRFTLSPFGGYIAYYLRPTDGGSGSVWIINTRDYTNVQITANTSLSSDIYWASTEKELIFTRSETLENEELKETVYKTYRIKFYYAYTEE
ncbi:MAG: hypothetical protein IKM61_03145 [Eubacteriaceae bacterium]|nr:hypothetical protein [Eubacteriaceae bacterium]